MLALELFLIVFAVILGSGLCSGTEAALASLSLLRIQQLAELGKPGAKALLQIKKNIGKASNTIVALNNIINIVGSAVITAIVTQTFGMIWLGLCSGILTFLIIIFAEVIPKAVGYTYPEKISLLVSRPLKVLIFLMGPFLYIINKITDSISKKQVNKVTERDVLTIIKAAYRDNKISDSEYEIAMRLFFLNDKTVGEIDTPRTIMTYLKANETLEECKQKILDSSHSRMPIINDSIDNVIGIALKQELMAAIIKEQQHKTVKDFCNKVIFVYETKTLESLLRELIDEQLHMAIVIDEYGGVEGVITLEDILEELMGKEIVDETDKVDDLESAARKKGAKKLTSSLKKQKAAEKPV